MPEEHSEFREWIEDIGYSSIIDYLPHLCEIAIDYGLLPHSNPGVMDSRDISRLKPLNARRSQPRRCGQCNSVVIAL
jgi:FO synthase subunit 1